MSKKTQSKIEPFINSFPRRTRRIFGICWKDKVCNEDLWKLAGEDPVELQIRKRKTHITKAVNNTTR